jgi:ABC-type transport system involved in multi-copper enzyme maturation permease subunit
VLTGYLGALSLATGGFLALASQADRPPPAIGAMLFSALAAGSVLLLGFITPALTTGAISGERERRTLDLLLVTRASELGITAGKLAGSLVYVFFLLAASLPAFGVVYLFAGVPLAYIGLTLLVATAVALAHASLGLLLSAVFKRSALASVLAYLIVTVLVFGLPLIAAVLGAAAGPQSYISPYPYYRSYNSYPAAVGYPESMPAGGYGYTSGTYIYSGGYYTGYPYGGAYYSSYPSGGPTSGPPPAYVYPSPITAINSVIPFGFLPIGGSMGTGPGATLGAQSVYLARSDPATGEIETVTLWAPWIYYVVFAAATTLVSLLGAALAIRPINPWVAWRIRRVR